MKILHNKINIPFLLTTLVSITIILQKVNSTVTISPLFDQLKLVTESGIVDLEMSDEDKFLLRKTKLTEDVALISLEYNFENEGVLCLLSGDHEEDSSEFNFQVNYMFQDFPFLLAKIEVQFDSSKEEELFKHFDDKNLVRTKSQVMEQLDNILGSEEFTKGDMSSPLFTSITLGTGSPGLSNFSLSFKNQQWRESSLTKFDKFKITPLGLQNVQDYFKQLQEQILEKTFEKAKEQLGEDPNSNINLDEKISNMEEVKKSKAGVINTLIEQHLEFISKQWTSVFSFPEEEAQLFMASTRLLILRDSPLIFSSGLFYLNLYLYSKGQIEEDPMSLVHQINESPKEELEETFIEGLTTMYTTLLSFYDTYFTLHGYKENSDEFCEKIKEKIIEYAHDLDEEADPLELASDALAEIDLVLQGNHFMKGYFGKSLHQFVLDLMEYIKRVEGETIFEEENRRALINTYLIFGNPGKDQSEVLGYSVMQGGSPIEFNRRLIIL
jgi:hypothetical protein